MGDHLRTALFHGPRQPLELRSFPMPEPAAGEVLVRISYATLCGSDVHTYLGRRLVDCPTVLGHEMIGHVAGLPEGPPPRDFHGRELAVGDRVTWSIAAHCGQCRLCRRGLTQKCQRLFKYGHQRLNEQRPFDGGLAECCLLAPGTAVFRVPDGLPDEVACPANCATATVAGALRLAGDCRDAVVLVQGAGALGLTAVAMARHLGAREVILCDVSPRRLAMAERFGATRVVSADAKDLGRTVHEASGGNGLDVALEMSGAPEAVEVGLPLLGIGGTYVLVGAVFPKRPAAVNLEQVVRNLLSLRGLHNYVPADLAAALHFLETTHTQYPFHEFVGATFSLDDITAAFEFAAHGESLRVAVVPKGNRRG